MKGSNLKLGLGLVLILLAGVSGYVWMNKGVGGPYEDSMSNVIDELIGSSSDDLPVYAHSSRQTQAGYAAALLMPEVFETVPCYCSCGAVGHRSLKDCFIEGDGFEEHASYCDICVSEALDVYMWQKQGLSLEEIRSRIDEKYSRFGEPTDTPEN